MENPIVIAPTMRMAEYLCRQILGINPREHAMSAATALRDGLRGLNKPTIIMYCADNVDIWKTKTFLELYSIFNICQAVVIELPEVTRVIR